jgi:predicted dehydrogenase
MREIYVERTTRSAQYLSDVRYNTEYPRRIRAAVVGCGSYAVRNVFPTFQYAPVDLVAVCDLDRARARDAARVFGAQASYTSMSDMLAAESPEVVFAVLNLDARARPRYPDVAVAALEAGAHVWIEKPPASTATEVERMILAASSARRFVGVGLKKMFSPANDKAREISMRPEFGGMCSITARYPSSLPAYGERGSDVAMMGFLDHIVHPFSILRLIGGSVESLWVEREPRTGSSLTTIRFTSGAIGNLHLSAGASWPAPLERTEIEAY